MSNLVTENLDERIERIKKRNEELEKKYKEAEEDRLMALKDNAMVEIKPPKDEHWPREHKYDKLDFTYDQKEIVDEEEDEDDEKVAKFSEKTNYSGKINRDYKKFPDGSGPPPDPSYNFLADAERDGSMQNVIKTENKIIDKKDWKQTNNVSNTRGGRGGGNRGRGRQRGSGDRDHRFNHHNPHTEYDAWKNERTKIDEERISRQKSSDGKWRREWDNDKSNSQEEKTSKPSERTTLGEAFNAMGLKTSESSSPKSPTNNQTNRELITETQIQPRGNIMVSVSQNGEVKSVKLTTAPIIGSGRVGRQISKPQFSIQKEIINDNGNFNNFERKISNSPQKQGRHEHHHQNNKKQTNFIIPDGNKVNVNDRLKRNQQNTKNDSQNQATKTAIVNN